MIIDGHAHACGDFLYPENMICILDANHVDWVALVPSERGAPNDAMPNLAKLCPERDLVPFSNVLARNMLAMSGAAGHLDLSISEEEKQLIPGKNLQAL